ncbi:MAG: APC family permease, partial [Candidatus Binataceae bacterium]
MATESNDQGPQLPRRRRSLTEILIGPARDLRDPRVFHSVSLIAFLAWVGMGSDGISSSCYGPEEMFLVLGDHRYLAVFLALMTAATVLIISASYSQIIDLFPSGGGGYVVATRLLGPYPGLVAGSALVIDYVLTIAISIASGADAIFSFLPVEWLPYKFWTALSVVALMILMNLRGVKESVMTLTPIFLSFIVMHVWLVLYAVLSHAPEIPTIVREAAGEAGNTASAVGWFGLAAIFFRAYSLGGGTFTGIEAVSNGLPVLREPKQVTGKRTMTYMAISLAFIASGLLLGYLLLDVHPQHGRTLNAVFFDRLTGDWTLAGIPMSGLIVTIALLSEGALLFVAAQTGFIDGPRVLANMAMDRWTPRRFSSLSTRLVNQDGVVAMGFAALLILFATGARVQLLVVLYAINVFVTFTLSQLGMSVHWWRERRSDRKWIRKILVNGTGCFFTALILTMMLIFKFEEGGWATVLMTGSLVAVCYAVRRHYEQVRHAADQLEADILPKLYSARRQAPPARNPDAPTAVLLVSGFNGLG